MEQVTKCLLSQEWGYGVPTPNLNMLVIDTSLTRALKDYQRALHEFLFEQREIEFHREKLKDAEAHLRSVENRLKKEYESVRFASGK